MNHILLWDILEKWRCMSYLRHVLRGHKYSTLQLILKFKFTGSRTTKTEQLWTTLLHGRRWQENSPGALWLPGRLDKCTWERGGGDSKHITKKIRVIYINTSIIVDVGYNHFPETSAGKCLQQGCCVSPALFNIYMGYVFRVWKVWCIKG